MYSWFWSANYLINLFIVARVGQNVPIQITYGANYSRFIKGMLLKTPPVFYCIDVVIFICELVSLLSYSKMAYCRI